MTSQRVVRSGRNVHVMENTTPGAIVTSLHIHVLRLIDSSDENATTSTVDGDVTETSRRHIIMSLHVMKPRCRPP